MRLTTGTLALLMGFGTGLLAQEAEVRLDRDGRPLPGSRWAIPIEGQHEARGRLSGEVRVEVTPLGSWRVELMLAYERGCERLVTAALRSPRPRPAGRGRVTLSGVGGLLSVYPLGTITEVLRGEPAAPDEPTRLASFHLTFRPAVQGSSVDCEGVLLSAQGDATFRSRGWPAQGILYASQARRTVVLVHGAWMGPASLADLERHLRAARTGPLRSYQRFVTPSWAGRPVGVAELVEQYAAVVDEVTRREGLAPLLVGHSFGGLIVQLLLDRGRGAAGVAIDPAPPRGVLPFREDLLGSLPVLRVAAQDVLADPLLLRLAEGGPDALRDAARVAGLLRPLRARFARQLELSREDFQRTWLPDLDPADPEVERLHREYVLPTSGLVYWDVLTSPLHRRTEVRFDAPGRPPLLLISGGNDRVVSDRSVLMAASKYEQGIVELRHFPGRTHWSIVNGPGAAEVATAALDWVETVLPAPTPDRPLGE